MTTAQVGREAEARVLDDAVRRASAAHACAVLVRGEAGIGKTSLVRAAVTRAQGDGATVLWAPCLRFAAVESTFLPLVLALERWRREGGDVRAVARIPGLSTLLPGLGVTTAPGPLGPLPVVAATLDALATAAPVVLVVDDVQWADAATRDSLTYVVAGLGRQRLCVVLTCRDEGLAPDHPVPSWWADLRRLPGVTECELRRLSQDDTEQQVSRALGGIVEPALALAVHGRSRGNPYLTELLVRNVSATDEALPSGVAEELEQALLRVWRGLSDEGRRLTQVLAVGGRPAALDALVTVLESAGHPSAADDTVLEAVHTGVLVRDGALLWFRHPLLAETLLETVPPDQARAWHALWAERFQEGQESGLEELRRLGALALHREGAGDLHDAVSASLAAADAARDLRARREEARHLGRATRLWPRLAENTGDLPDEVDVLIRAVRVSRLVGANEGALALVDRGLEAVNPSGDPLRTSWLVRHHDDLLWELGLLRDQPVTACRRAVAMSGVQPDSEEHALGLSALAMSLNWEDDPHGLDVANRALAAASRAGSSRAQADALASRAMARMTLGDLEGASADAVRQLELASGVDDPELRGWAAIWRSNVLLTEGRLEDHLACLSRARSDMIAEGALALVAYLGCQMADALLALGRLRDAGGTLHHSLALGGLPNYAAAVRLSSAQLASRTQRSGAAARAHVVRAAELVPDYVTRPGLEAPPALAEVLVAERRPDDALAMLLATFAAQRLDPRVLDLMTVWGATAAADLAERARDRGDEEEALEAADRLEELVGTAARQYKPSHDMFRATSDRDLVTPAWRALFEAERARCTFSAEESDAWWAAVQACDGAGMRWDAARARLRCALLATRGPRGAVGAAELLREVVRYADAEGATPLGSSARTLARATRVVLDDPTPLPGQRRGDVLDGLTPREREVLSQLMAGRTYAEVAAALFISEKTVSVHVSNLLRKTGTSSRGEVAALAARLAAH